MYQYQPTNPNYMSMPTYENTPAASGLPRANGASGYTGLGIGGLGSLGAGIGSTIGGLIGGLNYKNPGDPAMGYLNQIPGAMGQYYNPYIQTGNRAMGTLENTYNQLLQDPSQIMNKIGGSFQASPGYQYNVNQATNAANQAAAAGGMLGTPQEQQQLAQTVSGLANQDYYNYLNNALGLYGQGLGGLQGLNQMGYGASGNMAQSLKDVLESQANLSYAAQQAENERNAGQGGLWGSLAGGLGGMAAGLFGL